MKRVLFQILLMAFLMPNIIFTQDIYVVLNAKSCMSCLSDKVKIFRNQFPNNTPTLLITGVTPITTKYYEDDVNELFGKTKVVFDMDNSFTKKFNIDQHFEMLLTDKNDDVVFRTTEINEGLTEIRDHISMVRTPAALDNNYLEYDENFVIVNALQKFLHKDTLYIYDGKLNVINIIEPLKLKVIKTIKLFDYFAKINPHFNPLDYEKMDKNRYSFFKFTAFYIDKDQVHCYGTIFNKLLEIEVNGDNYIYPEMLPVSFVANEPKAGVVFDFKERFITHGNRNLGSISDNKFFYIYDKEYYFLNHDSLKYSSQILISVDKNNIAVPFLSIADAEKISGLQYSIFFETHFFQSADKLFFNSFENNLYIDLRNPKQNALTPGGSLSEYIKNVKKHNSKNLEYLSGQPYIRYQILARPFLSYYDNSFFVRILETKSVESNEVARTIVQKYDKEGNFIKEWSFDISEIPAFEIMQVKGKLYGFYSDDMGIGYKELKLD